MSKADYQNPVCGITGKELEWGERLWMSTYINGKLEQIPLYLSKDEVLKLHKQSPSYKNRNNEDTSSSEDTSNKVDNSAVSELNETTEEITV